MSEQSIAGNWRGHYAYHQVPDAGSSFSATFRDEENVLSGTVVDDFWPGEARLLGSFSFPTVSFTKTYVIGGLAPITYKGTMSGDGKALNGTWSIAERGHEYRGSWTAHRLDDENKKKAKVKGVEMRTPETEKAI